MYEVQQSNWPSCLHKNLWVCVLVELNMISTVEEQEIAVAINKTLVKFEKAWTQCKRVSPMSTHTGQPIGLSENAVLFLFHSKDKALIEEGLQSTAHTQTTTPVASTHKHH